MCSLLLLSAPTSAAPIPSAQLAVRVFPNIGAESEVEIGKPIASIENVTQASSLRLISGTVSKSAAGNSVVLPAGEYKLSRVSEQGRYYSSDLARLKAWGLMSDAPLGAGIFIPADETAPPAAYWNSLFGSMFGELPRIDLIPLDQSAFRRELIYAGVAQGVITISYREFVGDLARPAFTQELKYDLGAGHEIGFQCARIEILSATNTTVRYKMNRALEERAAGIQTCGR